MQSLPPGHIGCFEPGGTDLRVERYWSLPGAAEIAEMTSNSGSTEELLLQLLTNAVTKRMAADVPTGAFLSGGLDSSTVVALMSEHSTRPVATFTIGFEDAEGFDERPYARAVARHFGTDHTEFVVRPDAAAFVDRIIEHHDQPFGDSSALPTYLLSELTRRHVTVALCGDGGDEVFAGYERFAAATALSKLQLLPSGLAGGIRRTLDRSSPCRARPASRPSPEAAAPMPSFPAPRPSLLGQLYTRRVASPPASGGVRLGLRPLRAALGIDGRAGPSGPAPGGNHGELSP